MAADLRTQKRLGRLRQQADARLELTQAINRNVPDNELFGLFQLHQLANNTKLIPRP